ncbi:MAG: type II toxin-antitoxin system VapC family toxin [Chloroflexaceae bacterium]|nr:type II toxin-antitoxin system VapC family toxin [Chloroflexaceae bacterium]
MIIALTDTQSLIWYINADGRLSSQAKQAIDTATSAGNNIGFSAITLIEIIYLEEKQRLAPRTFQQLTDKVRTNRTTFLEIPVDYHVAKAMQQIDRAQVPDMPDRIIAATALSLKVPLITSDGKIRQSNVPTIW